MEMEHYSTSRLYPDRMGQKVKPLRFTEPIHFSQWHVSRSFATAAGPGLWNTTWSNCTISTRWKRTRFQIMSM